MGTLIATKLLGEEKLSLAKFMHAVVDMSFVLCIILHSFDAYAVKMTD